MDCPQGPKKVAVVERWPSEAVRPYFKTKLLIGKSGNWAY